MFTCKMHLEKAIAKALTYSNVNQAKLRRLDPKIEEQRCEWCGQIADYQVVPIKFGETKME